MSLPEGRSRRHLLASEEPCGLDLKSAQAAPRGQDIIAVDAREHGWWEAMIVAGAAGVFDWLGSLAKIPLTRLAAGRMAALVLAMFVFLIGSGRFLWKWTRFS